MHHIHGCTLFLSRTEESSVLIHPGSSYLYYLFGISASVAVLYVLRASLLYVH